MSKRCLLIGELSAKTVPATDGALRLLVMIFELSEDTSPNGGMRLHAVWVETVLLGKGGKDRFDKFGCNLSIVA